MLSLSTKMPSNRILKNKGREAKMALLSSLGTFIHSSKHCYAFYSTIDVDLILANKIQLENK